MLKYLLEKEFKQIRRNPFLPRMILVFPFMVLLVFPWAANFEIRSLNLCVIDNDHSTLSGQMIRKVSSSGYFKLTVVAGNYRQALSSVEKNKADIILEIPAHFERDLTRDQASKLMISANAVNGTTGGLGSYYLSGIIQNFSADFQKKWLQPAGNATIPVIEMVSSYRFNPHLNYRIYMVPALMVMLLTMICGFLPALNIVGEKEAGTMEQMNVTPVTRLTFIFSKLLPYWIIGFIVITISFGVAWMIYGLTPAGSLLTVYLFAAIYILGLSGFGLVISNYSETMQQAMFVMYFFIIILILMSGLFTPVQSMPEWAQWITAFNPLKYFMQVMRLVYLKGSGISELTNQLMALSAFALFFNSWAVLNYRKTT